MKYKIGLNRIYFQVKSLLDRTLSRTYFQNTPRLLQHQPKYSYTENSVLGQFHLDIFIQQIH